MFPCLPFYFFSLFLFTVDYGKPCAERVSLWFFVPIPKEGSAHSQIATFCFEKIAFFLSKLSIFQPPVNKHEEITLYFYFHVLRSREISSSVWLSEHWKLLKAKTSNQKLHLILEILQQQRWEENDTRWERGRKETLIWNAINWLFNRATTKNTVIQLLVLWSVEEEEGKGMLSDQFTGSQDILLH